MGDRGAPASVGAEFVNTEFVNTEFVNTEFVNSSGQSVSHPPHSIAVKVPHVRIEAPLLPL